MPFRKPRVVRLRAEVGNFRSALENLQREGVDVRINLSETQAKLVFPTGWADKSICGQLRAVFDPSGRKRVEYLRRDLEYKRPWVKCVYS